MRVWGWLFCAAVVAATTGCGATRQAGTVASSGFLGDYSQLEKGRDPDVALLVYVDEVERFSEYEAVLIDTVTVWQSEATSGLSEADAQHLTNLFYKALHDEISKDWKIATEPGTRVMRLRAAITTAQGANVPMNALTTVLPKGDLLRLSTGLGKDAGAFVGRASVEGELSNSLSGKRLFAAVDQRIGRRAAKGALSEWSDVEEALRWWAARVRERLAGLRRTR